MKIHVQAMAHVVAQQNRQIEQLQDKGSLARWHYITFAIRINGEFCSFDCPGLNETFSGYPHCRFFDCVLGGDETTPRRSENCRRWCKP